MNSQPLPEFSSPEEALAKILVHSKEPVVQADAARGLATSELGVVMLRELSAQQEAGTLNITPSLKAVLDSVPSDMVGAVARVKTATELKAVG